MSYVQCRCHPPVTEKLSFRTRWLVKERQTGLEFKSNNLYRPSDFVEHGVLIPIRPIGMSEQ